MPYDTNNEPITVVGPTQYFQYIDGKWEEMEKPMPEPLSERVLGRGARFRRPNSGRWIDPRCLVGLHRWGKPIIGVRVCLRDCGARKGKERGI